VNSTGGLSRGGRAFVGCVILAGGAAIAQASFDLYLHPLDWQWFILAGLTLLSGSITVKVPSIPATISVSETFVFTAVMLFGPSAGTITVALDCLIISLWLQRKKREAYKAVFNVASASFSLWTSAQLYFALSGVPPLSTAPEVRLSELLFPLVAFTITYFLLNSSLIAFAISLEKGTPAHKVWRENFVWLSLNFFSGASVAALLVAYTRRLDWYAVGIIIPILVISYLTYKTSMGRLEDTTNHLSELNLLYLSTIETLAMWIDAKDQITHGHIRRVQTFAVELARELGVKDAKLIKAIEAAALLHDMGKLAIPEHILNKPGKLTPGEFEKMKTHASIGAQILSAIDFPYPVVPIVRHHHECWDGSGYPDKLAGTDIPIGARILAVVDCFDALTSDRPYRPALRDAEALRMLTLRRGTSYDPLVVDGFLRVQSQLAEQLSADATDNPTETVLHRVRQTDTPGGASQGAGDSLISIDLRQGVGKRLLQTARQVVPVSLAVVYAHDSQSDVLVVAHTLGDGGIRLEGKTVRVGQGVSGWVAANRRAVANSDSSLDLGENFSSDGADLRSCLSLPVLLGDALLGVLSLYSTEADRFTADNKAILESEVQQFVNDLGTRFDNLDGQSQDQIPPGQNGHLERVFMHGQLHGQRVAVVVLSLRSVATLSESGAQQLSSLLDSVVRESVRAGDLTIRTAETEILVVLPHTDMSVATTTADRLARTISQTSFDVDGAGSLRISVAEAVAISPDHGSSLHSLVLSARSALASRRHHERGLSSTVH
jgi:putative nucleotidyltransferase with HDIG domain